MAGELTDAERERLRQRLMTYPSATEDSVEKSLIAYGERAELKQDLVTERGMSNALAEGILDRKGYPRPPGWRSVFFYPGSWRLRNGYAFLVLLIGGLIFFLVF